MDVVLAPDYSPALLGKAEALRMTRRYEEYFNVLDKYIVTEDTPAGAKGDYLMAVVQRTDPKSNTPWTNKTTKKLAINPLNSGFNLFLNI